MISFNLWYQLINQVVFQNLNFDSYYIDSILDVKPFYTMARSGVKQNSPKHSVLFFDQEPVHPELLQFMGAAADWYFVPGSRFFVTSEKSNTVDRYTHGMNATSIYYFFHAIAANEWYHQYRWDRPIYHDHKRTYISYNNLVSSYRAHRIDLLSRLHEKNLMSQGLVSFKSPGQDTLVNAVYTNTWYTKESREIFDRNKHLLTDRIIDTDCVEGYLSATIDLTNCRDSMVQIVTETDFYKDKLHLTEKVFKPMVAGQPFLLLAGVGNLEYLRSYGFKTFGDYWDEGYDGLADPGDRVGAVVKIVEDLSNLTHTQQQNMRRDMQHIVEHNFNHLFIELRPYVVAEMTNNIAQALKSQNISHDPGDLLKLYRLLVN